MEQKRSPWAQLTPKVHCGREGYKELGSALVDQAATTSGAVTHGLVLNKERDKTFQAEEIV